MPYCVCVLVCAENTTYILPYLFREISHLAHVNPEVLAFRSKWTRFNLA